MSFREVGFTELSTCQSNLPKGHIASCSCFTYVTYHTDGVGNVLYISDRFCISAPFSSYATTQHSSYTITLERIEGPLQSQKLRRTTRLRRYGSAQMNATDLSGKSKRILLVEDYEDEWEMVAFKLQDYKLTFARDSDEGLRLARQLYFDLYILDNWLPDRSGVWLCRVIREFDPYTPIMFYSAAAYDRDIKEALRAGAQAYLVKPVTLNELEHAVARLISPVDERDSIHLEAL
jgi:CheY-like chemotaxis protein